jgi:Divergent InlB B-repeat domain/Beta-propeller repeat
MIAKSPKPSLAMFFAFTACVLLAVCVPSFSADQPAASAGSTKSTDTAAQRARVAFGNLPVTFEPNQGQADAAVKYMTHWHGYNLFLTSKAAVFTMPLASQNSALLDLSKRKENSASGGSKSGDALASSPNAESVIRMTMPGANQQPVITSEDQQPGVKNYFIGNDPKNWHTNIPAFARVRYHDVYPGVDVVYHGTRQLEFDMVVGPGANPDKIKLSFDGAQRISTDDAGNLILTSEAGELRLQHPVSYQEKDGTRTAVDSRFVVKNDHEVVFALGSYDRNRELVIDPSISFATYFGGGGTLGSGEETGLGVAVDVSGNAYVVGTTNSSTTLPGNPTTIGSLGQFDCYVVEFNPSGAIVFTTIFGGTLGDLPQAVAVDGTGIYVVGQTQSLDFPGVTATSAQPSFGGAGPNGDGDAFVAKLTSDGSAITWATYLGGNDFDVAFALAVDTGGNVFVAGETFSSTGFPVVNNLPQGKTYNGAGDGFITEVSHDGTAFLTSSYVGGVNVDLATGVSWNSLNGGTVYVSGGTQSPNLPTTAGVFQPKCGTDQNCNKTSKGAFLDDAFIGAFIPTAAPPLQYVYLTYLGGGGVDDGLAITTDSTGNAYVTGKTASGQKTPFPVTSNAYQKTLSGSQNAFVSVLSPNGANLNDSTYLGGEGFDKGLGIALDGTNNVYVTGQTTSTKFPTANPTQLAFGGGNPAPQFDSDAFLSELSPDLSSLTFSTYIGGAGDEDILGGFVALDSTGDIYVVGDTNSINFPIQASGGKIADSSLNGGLGLAPICEVLNRQTGKFVDVVCPDAFVNLYTANTSGILVTLAGTGTGTVTSSPAGISCPGVGTCSASFPNPTQVTLTAAANTNSTFTGWSGGGCSGTAPCVINLTNLNQFVTATFTQTSANLSVTIVGTGTVTSSPAGISCPGTCTAAFPLNTKVTLTETPGTNFIFSGWSGGCTGTGTCAITLTKDEAVTATFTPTQAKLSVTVVGTGSVASTPAGISCPGTCSASFQTGTKVTLTATPGTDFAFAGWTGGGCSGTAPCVITLTSDQSVTATFKSTVAKVSAAIVGSGTVTSNPAGINCTTGNTGTCSATFTLGTQVTFAEKAAANSAFTAWSGGGCSGTGTCVVTVSPGQAVTATFQGFTIKASALSPSSVSPGGSATSTVTITPSGGFNTGNVNLTCTVASAVSMPPLCKVGAIAGGTSTLTVSTTPVMSSSLKRSPLSSSAPFYAMFLPISGMAFLGAGIGATSRKKKLIGLLLLCLMLSGLVFMAACGGGSTSGGGGGGGGGTPAGNYTITVKGTALGLSPTASVTLTVQ